MRETEAPFAYDGLDRVMHEKARLGLLTSLVGQPRGVSFTDLQRLCGLTQGNLSRHLAVLEEAGFVSIDKGFVGKRPHTGIRLTASGRKRFLAYLDVLESVVRSAADRARAGRSGALEDDAAAAPAPASGRLRSG